MRDNLFISRKNVHFSSPVNGCQSEILAQHKPVGLLTKILQHGKAAQGGGMRPPKIFDPSDSVPKFFIFEMDEGMLPVRLLSMTSKSVRVRA